MLGIVNQSLGSLFSLSLQVLLMYWSSFCFPVDPIWRIISFSRSFSTFQSVFFIAFSISDILHWVSNVSVSAFCVDVFPFVFFAAALTGLSPACSSYTCMFSLLSVGVVVGRPWYWYKMATQKRILLNCFKMIIHWLLMWKIMIMLWKFGIWKFLCYSFNVQTPTGV